MRFTCRFSSRAILTLENKITRSESEKDRGRTRKIIFDADFDQASIIIPWTFISRPANKCPVAQLFLTNLVIIFHPPDPAIDCPIFHRFPSRAHRVSAIFSFRPFECTRAKRSGDEAEISRIARYGFVQ